MTTSIATSTTNPQISALKSVFHNAARPIQWLVVTHNDPQSRQMLLSALSNTSAAILEISQDTWDFQGQQFMETIDWVFEQGEIKHIVLVGNSQAIGGTSRACSPDNAADAGETGYAKLVAGVRRQSAQNRKGLQSFASHVQQLSQIPAVHRRWSSNQLTVNGLYCRAESGVVLAYDPDADTFHPLIDNQASH